MSTTAILLIVACVVGAYVIAMYNSLVRRKNRFLNAFSQIDVQLQRRYELIPNLVEVAKGYLQHEHETLVEVTQARNNASDRAKEAASQPGSPGLVNALAQAEQTLAGAMGKLNVVMEDYPDLKADETMRDLHLQFETTENRVSFARQAYSDAVMRYNTYREEFPPVIVARLFAFQEADLFEVEDEAIKKPITVSFTRDNDDQHRDAA